MTGPAPAKAVLDACVLYPTVLRDILIGVAGAGLIRPVWSERLIAEWLHTALRHGGPIDADLARAEAARLTRAFPDARVPTVAGPDPGAEAALWLPDAGDIHVLATAIAARADMIVTANLRDFPRRELAHHGLVARAPDDVLMDLWIADAVAVETVLADVHARYLAHDRGQRTEAPETSPDLRALLKRARLPRLAKAVTR